ncbi:MAG: helix-turn-helix domain-containing protein [Chloroflexi bacterium]|nr:helix-turn-helix domain-containing protein [Chloroflexota bacterium]
MATRERAVDRGDRRGRRLVAELGEELRLARIGAGLSQAAVGRSAEVSYSHVSRIERGRVRGVEILDMARLLSVVGLELSARAYPVGSPLRDEAHLALLERFRSRLAPTWQWRSEVPIPTPGDLRAWDAVVRGSGVIVGIEAETRLRDVQAEIRRVQLKQRDSGVDHVVLLLAATKSNRPAVRQFQTQLRAALPISQQRLMACFRDAIDPGGSGLVLL